MDDRRSGEQNQIHLEPHYLFTFARSSRISPWTMGISLLAPRTVTLRLGVRVGMTKERDDEGYYGNSSESIITLFIRLQNGRK